MGIKEEKGSGDDKRTEKGYGMEERRGRKRESMTSVEVNP